MAVYKCKICGGSTIIDSKNGIAVCEYCGTKQALPLFTEKSEQVLYERGNSYLLQSEYDKATNVFNQLLAIAPNDPELYWDLVLCKYGVTYVCDPKTGKYIPTCNRTHYSSIFQDENYLKAIELSNGEKKELYESDAKTIDNIQKGIIEVSKKEKPFDIFISYKETDANGNRTKDSIVAQDLYEKLTASGYKVFFSRITLEEKIGSEYEPYIYAALYSSKVMLTISSSRENIEAVWVKNEWSRYLTLSQNDSEKTLIPLYFDMEKTDLPDDFSMLSAQNMKVEGFEQELLRGIKKLIPLPIMLAQKRAEQKKKLKLISIVASIVLILTAAISAPFIAKFVKNNNSYKAAMELFDNGSYTEAATAFAAIGDFKDAEEMSYKSTKEQEIEDAMQIYYAGNYPAAMRAFEAIGDYDRAPELKEKAKNMWRESVASVANVGAYINENGEYCTVEDSFSNQGIDVLEHGRIVSFAGGYALHNDGYVTNAKEYNKLKDDSEWHDIIKISVQYYTTNVALRADGKMLCGELNESEDPDAWIGKVKEWQNIVDFSYCVTGVDYDLTEGGIIGIKEDGTVCYTFSGEINEKAKDFLDSLQNVSKILLDCSGVEQISNLNIIALTKDGKMIKYSDGEISENDAKDICDIARDYALKNNGDMVVLGTDIVELRDIVYIDDSVAVSRAGTIYFNKGKWEKTNLKTYVSEAWIARLK